MNKMIITPALLSAVYEQPWNITGGHWRALHNAIQAPQDLNIGDFFNKRKPMAIDDNGIAHISIDGVLGKHAPISALLGDSDYGVIEAEIAEASNNASGALFHHNSPGGQTNGNLEIAEMAANMPIPTLSYCDGMMCSASYKIAAGTDYIMSSPSSLVGSIGTIIPYYDTSEALSNEGVKADFITSGDLKGAGMAPSLSDEQRESLQEVVNDLGDAFKKHVTNHRAVDADSMRGQAFVAPRAVDRNLVDRTGSIQSAYSTLIEMAG